MKAIRIFLASSQSGLPAVVRSRRLAVAGRTAEFIGVGIMTAAAWIGFFAASHSFTFVTSISVGGVTAFLGSHLVTRHLLRYGFERRRSGLYLERALGTACLFPSALALDVGLFHLHHFPAYLAVAAWAVLWWGRAAWVALRDRLEGGHVPEEALS